MNKLYATNAEAMNAQYGNDQFPIPSQCERNNLQPGAKVKVGINWDADENGFCGERFWVVVIERNNKSYLGNVLNHLLGDVELYPGDLIQFGPEHILDINSDPIKASPVLIMVGDMIDVVSGSPELM